MKSGNFPGARDGIPSTDNNHDPLDVQNTATLLALIFKGTLQSQFKMTFTIRHYRTITYRNVYNNIKKKSFSISLSFGI